MRTPWRARRRIPVLRSTVVTVGVALTVGLLPQFSPQAEAKDDGLARPATQITMLEVINSNNRIHYQGFVNALDKGWRVAPVCGNDNHGFYGITHHTSRTFVLATEKNKGAILDAMKHRRTYASLDQNIQCSYSVNGAIMGSTLERPEILHFDISIRDPDRDRPGDKITKIDIIRDGGKVAARRLTDPEGRIHAAPPSGPALRRAAHTWAPT